MKFRKRKFGKRKAKKRKSALKGGSKKVCSIALVKSPSQFVPDRLFVPMTWTSQYNNAVGTSNFGGELGFTLFTVGSIEGTGTAGVPNFNIITGTPDASMNANPYHMFTFLQKLYSYYRVYSSSIVLDIQKNPANGEQQEGDFAVSVHPVKFQNVSLSTLNYEAVTQQPFVKSLVYNSYKTGNKKLSNRINLEKLYGVTKNQVKTDTNFYAQFDGKDASTPETPVNSIVWQCQFSDIGKTIPTNVVLPVNSVCGTVRVTTMFEFFGRIQEYSNSV